MIVHRGLGLVGVALLAVASSAGSQGTTATVRVNLPVTDPVTVMDVSASASDFGTLGSVELNAGSADAAGPDVRVRSNRAFAVSIAAAAATFGPGAKPASDVRWSLSSGGPFTSLSTAPVTVTSSGSGGVAMPPLWFRMTLDPAADPPGSYLLSLLITLSTP